MQKNRKNNSKIEVSNDYSSEEKFILKNIEEFTRRLKEKFGYSSEEIVNLLQKDELLIPVEIFSYDLAPAESLTKYLKENHDKGFSEIAETINRNEKSLWQNYRRAKEKMPEKFSSDSKLKVPVSAFSNPKLSIFESLIYHLKEKKNLKNIKIAGMLKKHPANIWSVYNRAAKKSNEK